MLGIFRDDHLRLDLNTALQRIAILDAELYRTRAAAAGTSAAFAEWTKRSSNEIDSLLASSDHALQQIEVLQGRLECMMPVLNDTAATVARLGQLEPTLAGLSHALKELKDTVQSDALRVESGLTHLVEVLTGVDQQLKHVSESVSSHAGRLGQTQEQVGHIASDFSMIVLENTKLREEARSVAERVEALAVQVTEGKTILGRVSRLAGAVHSKSFDQFYLEFENHFRGSREDILVKMADYLPEVRRSGAGSPSAPILDLGCGRGEWLELLTKDGLAAFGHDLSSRMVEECRSLGLHVEQGDAIDRLHSTSSNSLGAVSSFHLVEHIPLGSLLEFLEECHRVLRPGGLLILETPNPQNLIVGACNFYIDPTHRNPIPPMTLRFMVERLGFEHVRVIPKHPFSSENRFVDPKSDCENRLNEFFFGAQDYAILATKRS
ncbi:MAG: methyltransferase domain-containing protein [Opitutaceae bacterium]|nr:methyltransferase domain-containing protein [Opitutaceae bacterium]